MINKLKQKIPWWAKIISKIILKRLPINGRMWQKIGLFAPGGMLNPDYAISVYKRHMSDFTPIMDDFCYLELGPGDSIATCIIAWSDGASKGYLVDYGAYASVDIKKYYPLIEKLISMKSKRDIKCLMKCKNIAELLILTHCKYMENGLESLKTIKDNSIDFIFSQAVLEHVRLSEFHTICKELYRIQKYHGIGSHSIDFKDHLGGSLNSLRFDQSLWEKDWFAFKSGFYTNRMRCSEVLTEFERTGFDVKVLKKEMWDKLPLVKNKLNHKFAQMDDADLLTKGADIITMKEADN